MTDCTDLLEQPVSDAFGESVRIDDTRGDCRIIFPFVRSDGDHVTLYVRDEDNQYVVTDAGETSGMLFTTGVNLDTPRRQQRVKAAEQRFDLDEAQKEIRLTARPNNLGKRVLDAYQAVQWISFLEYTRKPQTMINFRTKVASYLHDQGWSFKTQHTVDAVSERQTVDFAFANVERPTYMDSIHANSPSELFNQCRGTAYKWFRIRPIQDDARLISVVDDEDGTFTKEKISPIVTDSDAVVRWTERDTLSNVIAP